MEAKKSGDEAPFLKKYFRLLPLLAGIVLLFISHNILMAFPYQIVQRLGGDSPEMGVMLMVVSLVEIPVMVCFSVLLHRASSRFWVMISGISFFSIQRTAGISGIFKAVSSNNLTMMCS